MYKVVQKKGGLGWHEYTKEGIMSEEELEELFCLTDSEKEEIEEEGGVVIEGCNKYTVIKLIRVVA